MEKQYKEAMDSIHVPEELMNRTREAVREEEKKKKIRVMIRYTAAAACFCLVCLGAWGIAVRDVVVVGDFKTASADMTVGMNLGKHGEEESKGELDVRKCESAEEVPEGLWELESSRISRQTVYIGRDEDGVWHAAYEKDGEIFYITADDMDEKEFVKNLKEIL